MLSSEGAGRVLFVLLYDVFDRVRCLVAVKPYRYTRVKLVCKDPAHPIPPPLNVFFFTA